MLRNTYRILFAASLLFAAGCSSETAIRNVADGLIAQPDPSVQLLESELRWMEDNLYRMDNQLETCLRQLESTRRNNAALRLELANTQRGVPVGQVMGPTNAIPASAPLQPSSGNGNKDRKYDEEKDNEDLYNLAAPVVELGNGGDEPTPADDDGTYDLPEGKSDSAPTIPKQESILKPKPEGVPPIIESTDPFDTTNPFQDDDATAPPAELDQVTRIRLNPRLTGGYNFDKKAGHDGIMVVIEPQDAYARYVSLPGPVSVELIDPDQPGVRGQVGKWNFTAGEVQPLLKKTMMGKGIHLELPWPAGSPTKEQLELKITYQTPRGRKLTATRNLRISPTTSALTTQADAAEQGWYSGRPTVTPTATRWQPTR